ncbi:MAG: ATP-binding cassette domain-containing protein, partial [Candidatus Eremiobacteraeota bacterium]|nr:ATP-binding cassette domain-containing protein [Candidatus Eremiobacteraeota bacterium]
MALLELRALCKNFGGLAAVNNLTLDVQAGSIISLIGPNGAGKSTVFNLITGIYAPTTGSIVFEDRSLNGMRPDRVTAAGIARTFQNIRLFSF